MQLLNTDINSKPVVVATTAATASKEHVLNIAFISFVAFCILEAVFALLANSQSMLADAQAMSIDALTYLFNLAAEHVKNQPLSEQALQRLSPLQQARQLELRRLYLELVPPAISVSILIAITAKTLLDAFTTLVGENARAAQQAAAGGDANNATNEDDVSIQLMLFFSAANLLLDILNVFCFARANATYGLDVVLDRSSKDFDFRTLNAAEEGSYLLSSSAAADKAGDKEDQATSATTATVSTSRSSSSSSSPLRYAEYGAASSSSDVDNDDDDASISSTDSTDRPNEMVNLNMCSAWTHVCADTMRSTAVLIAASIATVFPSIPGETADAAAAVAVSIIILISLIPLIQGLVLTAFSIRHLSRNPVASSAARLLNKEESGSSTTRPCHECAC